MKKFLFLIAMVAFVSGSSFAQTDTTMHHKMKHKKAKTSKMDTKKTDKKSTQPM